jgi:deoxycytidine triphosphate deaminase
MSGTNEGGVLSAKKIQELVDAEQLMVGDTFHSIGLRPAAYDVRVAAGGLIAPDATEIPPMTAGREHDPSHEVTLKAGDTAVFSTAEYFHMPSHIAGNMSIKNRYAARGLMLLSGMLIDPGFGSCQRQETGDDGSSTNKQYGLPLHLHVVNLGVDPITIRPGEDRIASVQFLQVDTPDRWTAQISAPQWKDQKRPSLGFLAELQKLSSDHKDLERTVSDMNEMVKYVVWLGFILLGTTILGVILATILSLASKH